MEPVASIHWLGKKKVSTDTNSADLMQVWAMPETLKLQEQTLDKFSAAPWRFLRFKSNPSSTNLLHPLLQDLVDEESYLEIDQPTNSTDLPGEMVLAVRLTDQRAALWQTNVAAALNSLTGISLSNASPGLWVLKKHHFPDTIEVARIGEWTILGAAQNHNDLFDATLARLKSTQSPFPPQKTNSWLNADIIPARLAVALRAGSDIFSNLPPISLAVTGGGGKVWTAGTLQTHDFNAASLKPWSVPTNIIQSDFTGFTAIRGVSPFLQRSPIRNSLNISPAPDQIYIWSLIGFPTATYFAAPFSGAGSAVSNVTDFVLEKQPVWFGTNPIVRFKKARDFDGLQWGGLPYISPFLRSISGGTNDFVFGGLFVPETNYPSSPEVFKQLYGQTNLVYYDWEHTGLRVEQLIYLGQFVRFGLGSPQLPTGSPGLLWLKAIAKKPGDSLTTCEVTAPGQLKFVRSSSTGFTAVELHLLVQELEFFESAKVNQ
jgi:hypothetical protein